MPVHETVSNGGLKGRSSAQLKCIQPIGEIIQRYRERKTCIATVPTDEIAGVRITVRRGHEHPGSRRFSPKRVEHSQAVCVSEIGHHDQSKEEGFALRLQRRLRTSFDADLEASRFQPASKLDCVLRARLQQQYGERGNWLRPISHDQLVDEARGLTGVFEIAVRIPVRICRGLGGQPGTATSTGITFDTRPHVA